MPKSKIKHPRCYEWSEKKLQNNFKAFMKRHNILNYKTGGGMFSTANGQYMLVSGWSDLIIPCKNREVLYVELKTHYGKIRQTQANFFNHLLALGNNDNLLVFHAHQWEDFKKYYKQYDDISLALKKSASSYMDELENRGVAIEKPKKEKKNGIK